MGDDDWKRELQIERIQRKQENAEYKNRKELARRRTEQYNAMGPADLARDLRERCNIEGLQQVEELEARLLQQALTLDSSFMTSMHHAGLGHKTDLHLDTLKTALSMQKLCRQTYDSLKPPQPLIHADVKIGKQTEEVQNHEA